MDILKSMNPNVQSHYIGKPLEGWRLKLYTIIFEADTRAGRLFDLTLLMLIVLSITVVFADSVICHLKQDSVASLLQS